MSLPVLKEKGFFEYLDGKISFSDFQRKIIHLAKTPCGVSLSIGIIAQVLVSGKILKSISHPMIKDISNIKKIVSLGVSESNWKGKLINISSKLNFINGQLSLNGEKSFITNGAVSDSFILLVKFENQLKLILLNRETLGLEIEPFQLPFIKETSHCRLKMKDIKIHSSQILDFDYANVSETIKFTELLSLSCIFIGYANSLLAKLKTLEPADPIQLYKLYFSIDLFENHIINICERKDENPSFDLKKFYPFGSEFFIEDFYEKIYQIFSKQIILENDLENQLFTSKDIYNSLLIKKAAFTRINSKE